MGLTKDEDVWLYVLHIKHLEKCCKQYRTRSEKLSVMQGTTIAQATSRASTLRREQGMEKVTHKLVHYTSSPTL